MPIIWKCLWYQKNDQQELNIEMPCVSMAVGGRGGRGRGGRDKDRDQKPLTKEALDADLDEVLQEEKKFVWHLLLGCSIDIRYTEYIVR